MTLSTTGPRSKVVPKKSTTKNFAVGSFAGRTRTLKRRLLTQAHTRAFVSNVPNPITAARIDLSMSLSALGKRLGLSKQYLNRAEQGTYSSLNPALLKWIANTKSISVGAVEHHYRVFQSATRARTKEVVEPTKLTRYEGDTRPGHVIFEAWRSGYWTSPLNFANELCVHPEVVRNYEEGHRPKMADTLMKVLKEVDLIDEDWSDEPPRPKLSVAV